MTPSGVITLLTDFGTRDPFVGVMKGAILARGSRLSIVDLSHAIEPQRVGDAAFWLAQAHGWFPAGTVHVAVVDPGVGTARRAVVARAGEHCFVAPDNGVLEVVARRASELETRAIDADRLGIRPASRTFHGRDLFAPIAALLAAGELTFEAVGPRCDLERTANVPEPRLEPSGARGEVVVIDHFGNLITNLLPADWPRSSPSVTVNGRDVALVGTYADVSPGTLGAVTGSFGQLELFVRNGSAVETLSAQRGTPVSVHW